MLKVDYKKRTKEGTIYNQTITIDTATARAFNNWVAVVLLDPPIEKKLYLQQLENAINYTTLTTLHELTIYLSKYTNENLHRIKHRNTIIIVK